MTAPSNRSVTTTTTDGKDRALAKLPEFNDEDADNFNEGMDAGAVSIPFLGILQALSPQVQRGSPVYIPGASPGQLYNTVTKEIADAVEVAVIRRTHTFCFWTPRDKGGGFKGEQPASPAMIELFNSIKPDEKGRRITPDALEMTEHRNFYCAEVVDEETLRPLIVSMTKSQLKPARDWNYNLAADAEKTKTGKPILFSTRWVLTSELRTRNDNNWFVWKVAYKAPIAATIIAEVRALASVAKTQEVLVRPADLPEEEAAPAEL